MSTIIQQLYDVLLTRKNADADNSYVASLYAKGTNKILEKIGEEATETILAAKDLASHPSPDNKAAVIAETADLWFHCLVMMAHCDVEPDQVLTELQRRFGVSGLEEKAQR